MPAMTIVWYQIRGEREAIVIPQGVENVSRYDCQYASGLAAPHYPLPVCERDNALAASNDRVTFFVKSWLL